MHTPRHGVVRALHALGAMRVVDLAPEHQPLFLRCLEDWNPETGPAARHRARWYDANKPRGLRVKLAMDDEGRLGGMIQYLPIENAPALGHGLYFIHCIWVHGHAQGRGDFQGHGMGCALLEAAEADARALGASGMAAWGVALPLWMRASWFKRHGYRKADRNGVAVLLWKPFIEGAEAPRWLPRTGKRPELVPGKVVVTACSSGWCTAQAVALERALDVAATLGDDVVTRIVDTNDRATLLEWGEPDTLWIDDKRVVTGPPPSRDKLLRIARRRVRRLHVLHGA